MQVATLLLAIMSFVIYKTLQSINNNKFSLWIYILLGISFFIGIAYIVYKLIMRKG